MTSHSTSHPAPHSDAMSAMRHAIGTRKTTHFKWHTVADGRVGVITLARPERKNPLTFESYAELRDLFRDLVYASDVRAIVLTGEGGNFCSGGDVFEIIEPLTRMAVPELLAFTRMTGDLVKAMRACPQPIIAAVDGIAAGAGAGWQRVGGQPAVRHLPLGEPGRLAPAGPLPGAAVRCPAAGARPAGARRPGAVPARALGRVPAPAGGRAGR